MPEDDVIGELIRTPGNVNPHPELKESRYKVTESCPTCPIPVLILEVFIRTERPAGADEADHTPPRHNVEPLLCLK